MGNAKPDLLALNIALLTVSDTRRIDTDSSGAYLEDAIRAAGHRTQQRLILPDDRYRIRAQVAVWIADPQVRVVIVSGGTGFTGRDSTPEAIAPLLDKEMPGFGEQFRALSFAEIGTSSLQSRAFAGIANATFVFALPGSTGACKTAWEQLIKAQLDARTKPCNLVGLIPRLHE